MDTTVARFIASLDLVRNGSNGWRTARCPFHEDRRASFSFNEELNGWHCFAGCGSGKLSIAARKGPKR